jgi:dTDP-4-amino-4,6-dideoxygalactose transaminase
MYANHGALVKHDHLIEGINSRLDGIQASLLSAKLAHLPKWTESRRGIARLYDKGLAQTTRVTTLPVRRGAEHVYHLYVVRAHDRRGLQGYLTSRGIETAIHYPRAVPLQPAYARLAVDATMIPNAARAQDEILSLPMYAELPAASAQYVCECIAQYYRENPPL